MAPLAFVFDEQSSNDDYYNDLQNRGNQKTLFYVMLYFATRCIYNVFISITRRMAELRVYTHFRGSIRMMVTRASNIIFNCNIN